MRIDTLARAIFIVVNAVYFARASSLAAHAPFWMDEVLSIWTARQPDAGAVWSALVRGSEFTPPAFDLMLHFMIQLGASGPLAMRLPSIVAAWFAALAVAVLVRRYSPVPVALAAAAVVLSGGLFDYAIQARPYACVTAAFAWAIAVWDRPRGAAVPMWRAVALAALLALAVAFHFYALLLVGMLGLAELVKHRFSSPATLAAIILAGISILSWWPILHAAGAYAGSDVFAPDYYGRPTLLLVSLTTSDLIGWTAYLLGALFLFVGLRGDRPIRFAPPAGVAMLLLTTPLVVFAFALTVSHSYAQRYALVLTLGLALLVAWLIDRSGRARVTAVLVMIATLIALPLRSGGTVVDPHRLGALADIGLAPGELPIVVADGMRFLELRENASPAVARRLVYLDVPALPSNDPTDRHQVERWKVIDPSLPVVDGTRFVCGTPAFLLFTEPSGRYPDPLPDWLASRATIRPLRAGGGSFHLIRPRPCARGQVGAVRALSSRLPQRLTRIGGVPITSAAVHDRAFGRQNSVGEV